MESSFYLKYNLDAMSRGILRELQDDARLSFSELGRRVGLSTPAVVERVRRLEEAGIIAGYPVRLDAKRLGYAVTAFVSLTTERAGHQKVRALAMALPEVMECHHMTGDASFLIKVRARSVEHLERVVERFSEVGRTSTAIALSTYLEGKPVLEEA